MNETTLQHIHSHQDREMAIEDFSLDALLNKAANELATESLVGQSPAKSPLLPAAQVNLEFQGVTITHHFQSQIHYFSQHCQYW